VAGAHKRQSPLILFEQSKHIQAMCGFGGLDARRSAGINPQHVFLININKFWHCVGLEAWMLGAPKAGFPNSLILQALCRLARPGC